MALSRVKTWSSGEVLTASDLNAEYNNILNNAISLISPLTANLDMDAKSLIIDGDADTSLYATTDDKVEMALSGTSLFVWDGTTTTPVNGITFTATATGTRPRLGATGSDTNLGLGIRPKGTGAGASVVIEDGSGNEVLIGDVATSSAVNEVTVTNAATGTRPRVAASGGDTNVGLALRPKGTGAGASVILEDGSGNEVLIAGVATASAVNEVTVTNAATGNPARIHASGETNVSLQIEPKGSGKVTFTDGTDTTKKINFDVSNVGTGQNRTVTWPNADLNLNSQSANTVYAGPSSGAAAAPAFRALVGADGASEVYLATKTASTSASLTFTSSDFSWSAYNYYIFRFRNLRVATDNQGIVVLISQNAGSSYISTGSYDFSIQGYTSAAAADSLGGAGSTSPRIVNGASNTAAEGGITGTLVMHSPNSSSVWKLFHGKFTYYDSTGNLQTKDCALSYKGDTNAINGIQFTAETGNLADGSIDVYGVRTA